MSSMAPTASGLAVDDDVGRLAPDRRGDFAHSLDEPAARGDISTAESARRATGDVLGEVAVAFDLGQDAQQDQQFAPAFDVEGRALEQALFGRETS